MIMRIITAIIMHTFFWEGVANLSWQYFTYYTGWAMTLSMIAFTLSSIGHIRESWNARRKNSNLTGLDSSLGDDSTFLAFTPGAMNPYSPTG
jgi:hypothetical protein